MQFNSEQTGPAACTLPTEQQAAAIAAFEALMPTFSDPNCANCHGGITDPYAAAEIRVGRDIPAGHTAGAVPFAHPILGRVVGEDQIQILVPVESRASGTRGNSQSASHQDHQGHQYLHTTGPTHHSTSTETTLRTLPRERPRFHAVMLRR